MLNFFKKLQGLILIIFLFSLPWQTRWIINPGLINNEYWEYGTISLYASDILLLILIIFNLISRWLEKIKINLTKSDLILLLIFLLGSGFNLFLATNKILALFHLAWLVLALSLFTILRQEIISRSSALIGLIFGAGLSSLLGVWQFISQNNFAFKWLGLASHKADELGSSVIEAVAPDGFIERWLRAYGSLDHPNMLGGLTAIMIFFCFYLLSENLIKNRKETLIISSFVILLTGLIVSFSRAGLIGAGLGFIIYLIFAIKNNFKQKLKQTSPLIIISSIIIILFAIPYHYLLTPRFTLNTRLEKISATERIAGYKEAWPLIKNNLITGVGLGNYGLALAKENPKKLVWFYQPIHNTLVLLVAETGLIGLIVFLWFIIKKIKVSIKKYSEDKMLIFGTIIILLFLGLFDHWLLSLHFGLMLTATCLGLSLKK